MSQDVQISSSEGVQLIRFARVGKKNAITSEMYAAMCGALAAAEAGRDIAVHMLAGSGGAFSAGSDIGEFMQRATGNSELGGPILDFIRLLPRLEKPLVAAVDGLAIGLGTTMLLHCDLVYASPASTFRTPFLDLGLVPEAGSSLLAPLRMGHARAFELLALGETFTAERALAAGLVNAVLPPVEVEGAALAAAHRLARKPPEALALCRKLMRGDASAVCARVDEEARIFADRLTSPEAREAFAAFLEKRPPDFSKARSP
jgi:enoyl-CoA hydratase/carnithine racemase